LLIFKTYFKIGTKSKREIEKKKFLSSSITMSFLREIEMRKNSSEKTPEKASTESVNTEGKIYIRLIFLCVKINGFDH